MSETASDDRLAPDATEAERFLTALDPDAKRWTFQTFDDDAKRKDPDLVRVLHGTLTEHWGTLRRLNERGAGIFVTVNETDGRGRKTENITRVRALYNDLDGAPLEPVLANGRLPHIVTETSPKRWHTYYRVVDFPLNQFTGAQRGLIELFGGDPSVHDLPRVMRLPGFIHRKGEPFLSRIVSISELPPYRPTDFPRAEVGKVPLPDWLLDLAKGYAGAGSSTAPEDLPPKADAEEIRAALAEIDPDLPRDERFKIAVALKNAFGDQGFSLWNDFFYHCKKYPGLDVAVAKWKNLEKDKYDYGVGSIFRLAYDKDSEWKKKKAKDKEAGTKSSSRNYELVWASDVVARAKKWLWQGHLLCGAQELLTGVPGLAKSQLQCGLVACATTGGKWPDGSQNGVRVNVIMVTAEDTLDQEVVPRLIAAGANRDAVFFLKAIKKDKSSSRMFLLSEDIMTLEQIISDVGNVGLVTIDPITAFMGKVDSHQVAVVRSQLGPLKDLAERTEVGFSTITHPAKNAGPRAIDHFIGSQAFIAAGRIGHLCIEEVDEDNKPTGRILFTNPKNNPSPRMPTLAYRIEQMTVGQDPATGEVIVAPRVVWDATPVQMTADQAIAATTGKKKEPEAMNNAMNFLRPRPVEEIKEAAKEAGLSWSTVRRAQEELKIIPEKEKGVLQGPWFWSLPEEVF